MEIRSFVVCSKFLCQNGPTNFSKLMDTFVVEENIFQNTIRRWDQLGVIVQTGDEVCMSGISMKSPSNLNILPPNS